jgi:hypothetical protein
MFETAASQVQKSWRRFRRFWRAYDEAVRERQQAGRLSQGNRVNGLMLRLG